MSNSLGEGDRIRHTETGVHGRLLRYEKYPGSHATWATVKWDHGFFARRVDPAKIERVLIE